MAFNLEFLQVQRDFEYGKIKSFLTVGAKILEIGAGTGYQAKRFSDDGFVVDAIDLNSSIYSTDRIYPVQDYDAINIPFPSSPASE